MYRRYFVWVFSALLWLGLASCEKLTPETAGVSDQIALRSSSNPEDIGRLNAVKKCYQMTDFKFKALNSFDFNKGSYEKGQSYTGMMYSSVTETGTFAGINVNLYTISSALANPRSLVYTEKVNETPYHGSNCASYYGISCSYLVSHALGLVPPLGVGDFPAENDIMADISSIDPDDIQIADIVWSSNHVMIITDVIRNKNGEVVMVEISEAAQYGCERKYYSKKAFRTQKGYLYTKLFRYLNLGNNNTYQPMTDVVAVIGESATPLNLNQFLCVNKGNRSNYLAGEDVVVNLFQKAGRMEVFRDDELYKVVDVSGSGDQEDICLKDLPYGKYKACLISLDGERSESAEWIVVDYSYKVKKGTGVVDISSKNSSPYLFRFCNIGGKRPSSSLEESTHLVAKEEIEKGSITVGSKPKNLNYFVLQFATEYGIIQTLPIMW